MRAARVILLSVILASLMVPLAQGITFIGAINFIATHGGTVRFAQSFQATSLSYPNGLNIFTNLIWGGTTQGILGFDITAGGTMTVTGITGKTVTYTVTAPSTTYIYAHDRGRPTGSTGTTTLSYNSATEITTVTSGVGAVTITWEPEVYELFNGIIIGLGVFAMVPLAFAAFYILSLMKSGEPVGMNQMIFVLVLVVTSFIVIGALLRLYL